jgi:hypothetical protein
LHDRAAGHRNLTLTTAGARVLGATYGGDANFNSSISPTVGHTVILLADCDDHGVSSRRRPACSGRR